MVTEKIKQLADLQAKAEKLQQTIEVERTRELAALPSRYGYDSIEAFVKALKAAAGAAPKGKKRGRKPKAGKAAKPAAKGKRGRTKITAELKASVIAAVNAGKTGSAIAKEFGISVPSVQNIKKEAGLVKARKDAAPAA